MLESERIDVPEPGAGEVLVRVQVASANPVDIKTRSGRYPLIGEDKLPYTLDRDFSGVVERVGSGVSGWKGSSIRVAWRPDALPMLEKGHVHGKIVVDVAGSNARTT